MRATKKISVIGLGKLGLCLAATLADKGFKVTGLDIDKEKVKKINQGISPIKETGLAALIKKVKPDLQATTSFEEAILKTQVSFIIVPTPSLKNGSFSNRYIKQVLKKIATVIKKKSSYHLVVISSTVMPQTTEKIAKPLLEKISGKNYGQDFGLAYNPQFIALGSVIYDLINPNFVLIGQGQKKDGDLLAAIYKKICANKPMVVRISPVNAEITKLALNCYITNKISFANALAEVCEKVSGADAHLVTQAIGLDRRIGRQYLKPGLGYGGPCFPRDNLAFAVFAKKVGSEAGLAKKVDKINRKQAERIFRIAKKYLKPCAKVSVLGLAYKPQTPVIEESQAMELTLLLVKAGYRVSVYDPQAQKNAYQVLKNKVNYAQDLKACLKDSQLAIITTPWEEFKKIDTKICKNMKKPVVFDCWNLIEKSNLKGVEYLVLGKGNVWN